MNTFLIRSLLGLLLTAPVMAAWQSNTFTSGSLKHAYAVSDSSNHGAQLELFCSADDPQPVLALYLPQQRFRRRASTTVRLRVDKQQIWTLPATQHAMAILAFGINKGIIKQLSNGNRARIIYQDSSRKNHTETFILNSSGAALRKTTARCAQYARASNP